MTTPDPKRRDIAAESAASVANLQGFLKDHQARQLKSLAITSVPMVAMAAFAAKRQAEWQNAAMLDQQQMLNHQMWIQNQLLSGRSMSDIQDQIFTENARAQAADARPQAASAAFSDLDAGVWAWLACFLGVLLSPFLIWGLGFISGWAAIFTFIGLSILGIIWVGKRKVKDEDAEGTTGEGSMAPNIGSGEHSQWVEDFRTEQASKQKDDPPTD